MLANKERVVPQIAIRNEAMISCLYTLSMRVISLTKNEKTNPTATEIRNNIKSAGMSKKDSSWGYSDGEDIFMHIDKGFYRLNRAGNTFEVVGPAVVEYVNTILDKAITVAASYRKFSIPGNYYVGLIDFSDLTKPSEVAIEYYKFFSLNMDSGVLY